MFYFLQFSAVNFQIRENEMSSSTYTIAPAFDTHVMTLKKCQKKLFFPIR